MSFDRDRDANRHSQKKSSITAELLPDLHAFRRSGTRTELASNDAEDIRRVVAQAAAKAALLRRRSADANADGPARSNGQYIIGGYDYPQPHFRTQSTFRAGWNSLINAESKEPSPPIPHIRQQKDVLGELLPDMMYGEWYHNAAALFGTAILAFLLGKTGADIGVVILCFLALGTYYQTSMRRFRFNTRDDIQRELAKLKIEADEESVEWMNNFLEKFWLIFEPVLSAIVVENLDNYLPSYLPSFLDSVRLTTFTLGTKPFRIESVRTYNNSSADTVCMDWRFSFTPGDLSDLLPEQANERVNPRVTLHVRFGRGSFGAGFPVLLEEMTFSGHIRIKIKFFSKFPYAKILEVSFLEKPLFDYVLKPMGTDTFGFDVNVIPGLQTFISDQVHAILGPLMYAPNVFTFDVEKFLAGEFDINQANGVLAVTIHSSSFLQKMDEWLQNDRAKLFIRFYVDHGQEIGRTSMCRDNLSPTWNETKFLPLNSLNAQLSLELRAHLLDAKDRRVGTANFDLRILDDESRQTQEGLDLLLLYDGKPVCDLRADLHYLPVLKQVRRTDGTIEPVMDSNSGILRLIVHECELVERTDSFCRVLVNSNLECVTKKVRRNINPTFEQPCEVVILDRTSVYIRVEVRSNDKETDVKLGHWTSTLTDIMNQQEQTDAWWELVADNGRPAGRLRVSAQWKPVDMTNLAQASGSHGYEAPAIGVVRFTFWKARDLLNVELSGKSDPYVRVMSGFQMRAHTEVKLSNLNPEWGEVQYVPVHSVKERLHVEVMDWNYKTKDRSLGLTELDLQKLIRQCVNEQTNNSDSWFDAAGEAVDRCERLRSVDRRTTKGELVYRAEFFPTLALPKPSTTLGSTVSLPLEDLHGDSVKYTPDQLLDLQAYPSGVLQIKVGKVNLNSYSHVYCSIRIDSVYPQYRTAKHRGTLLNFDETADVFVKDVAHSKVVIELKMATLDDKNARVLDFWTSPVVDIIQLVQHGRRDYSGTKSEISSLNSSNAGHDDNESNMGGDPVSHWFHFAQRMGVIHLSFDYLPVINFVLPSDESPSNQGELKVKLLSAKNLKAVDKSGTSDPYVVFTVNGKHVYKSSAVKKSLNPSWPHTRFSVPIYDRHVTSFRLEVFDWNQIQSHEPIGTAGLSLCDLPASSDKYNEYELTLDGVEDASGSVLIQVRWEPRILSRIKHMTDTTKLNVERRSAELGMIPLASMSTTSLLSDQGILSDPGNRSSFDTTSIATSFDSVLNHDTSETKGQDGALTIQVLRAQKLFAADKSGTSDPYVKISLGTKKVGKTKAKMMTLSPEWNEEFSASVTSAPTLITFKVMDHNRIQRNVVLGTHRQNIWELIKPGKRNDFEDWLPLADNDDPQKGGEIFVRITFSEAKGK